MGSFAQLSPCVCTRALCACVRVGGRAGGWAGVGGWARVGGTWWWGGRTQEQLEAKLDKHERAMGELNKTRHAEATKLRGLIDALG